MNLDETDIRRIRKLAEAKFTRGDWVSWQTRNSTEHGKVIGGYEKGEDMPDFRGSRGLDPEEGEVLYALRMYKKRDGKWHPIQGKPIGHYEDSLESWGDAPSGDEVSDDYVELSETERVELSVDRVVRHLQRATAELDTRYEIGDAVLSPDGPGVVAAASEEDMEFPTGEDSLAEISGSENSPAYIVALGGMSGAYRASDLEEVDASEAEDFRSMSDSETDGEAIAVVDTVDYGAEEWADGWDRYSLLSFFMNAGAEVSVMAERFADERGFDGMNQALGLAAKAKDQAVGTERWRSRF
jgi:hypothetical protein